MTTVPRSPPAEPDLRLAHALIFVAPALWSVNYLAARWAPGTIAPHALALGRWCVAALLLAAVCWREIAEKRHRIRFEATHFLVLGALGMWVCGAFVYIGGRSTSAINIGLLYSMSPVLIAIVSAIWLYEPLRPLQWLGAALALAGMLNIVFRGDWARALLDLKVNPGDLWIAFAVLSWTAYSLLLRIWPSAFGPVARLTLIAVGGIVVLIPFTALEALLWLPSQWSMRSLALVLTTALIPGAGAYAAYSYMQRKLGAARVGLVLYLSPLYSAAIAWAVLGESVEAFHAVAALLILPGMWLATRR
ncbi:MAG: DMT family transporter [Burkholderiaceae bacterium]